MQLKLHRHDPSFTVALALAGVLALVSLLRLLDSPDYNGAPPGFHPLDIVAVALVLFIAAAAVPVPLRAIGARAAFPITGAACWILLFWFPVGTGLFVWWVMAARDREAPPAPLPAPRESAGFPSTPVPPCPKIGGSARSGAGEFQGERP